MSDRGEFIGTAFGKPIYPLDLRADEIQLNVIALSLAKQCRYMGHIRHNIWHYSVAQHSVHVSYRVPHEHAKWALLHDAHEAYTGDIVRPLKKELNKLTAGLIKQIEGRAERVIAQRFGLSWPMPDCVKQADERMLATEVRDVMAPAEFEWSKLAVPYNFKIVPVNAEMAYHMFMERAESLGIT